MYFIINNKCVYKYKWALNFVKSCFNICLDDHRVFFFNLLMCYVTLIDLWMLKKALHSWNKSHLIMIYVGVS